MLRELVKNKELLKMGAAGTRKKELPRYSSVESDVSDGSTLVSTGSEAGDMAPGEHRKKARINHHTISRTNTLEHSDAELDLKVSCSERKE